MTTVGTLSQWRFGPFHEKVTGGCEGCNTKSGIYISHVIFTQIGITRETQESQVNLTDYDLHHIYLSPAIPNCGKIL